MPHILPAGERNAGGDCLQRIWPQMQASALLETEQCFGAEQKGWNKKLENHTQDRNGGCF